METLKKRQRFTDHDDLVLLREVLGLNPFEDPALWSTIQEHIFSITAKMFNIRTLKCHLELLIKLWLEQYKALKDKSGIEITETEKDTLCHNIYDIMNEYKQEKRKKTSATDNKRMGIEARKKWTSSLQKPHEAYKNPVIEAPVLVQDHEYSQVQENIILEFTDSDEQIVSSELSIKPEAENIIEAGLPDDLQYQKTAHNTSTYKPSIDASTSKPRVLGPVRSRKRKITAQKQGLEYLQQYDKQQKEMKERELDLAERKMKLEEKQFVLMEFKVKKKIELQEKQMAFEAEERKSIRTIIERQDSIIRLLLSKFT